MCVHIFPLFLSFLFFPSSHLVVICCIFYLYLFIYMYILFSIYIYIHSSYFSSFFFLHIFITEKLFIVFRIPPPSLIKFDIVPSRMSCFGRVNIRRKDFIERSQIFFQEFFDRGYLLKENRNFVGRFLKKKPLQFSVKGLLNNISKNIM